MLGCSRTVFENHFRHMFLNVTRLKYITCMHSFKAALIAFFGNIMTYLTTTFVCNVVHLRFDMK